MGNSEGEKPSKSEKPSSPPRTQEQSNVHVYPDWAAVQAYYGAGAMPPPYFNPAVTPGHAAHPYIWAPPQMMPPYASPYAAMYPHGGIYGPSATPVCMQVATPLSLETPTRSSGNDSGSAKKPKESEVAVASSNGNAENAGAQGQSHSTDCGTDGSYDRSDDSTTREDDNVNNRSNNGVTDTGTCPVQIMPYPSIDANSGNNIVPGIPMVTAKPVEGTPVPTMEINHSTSKANANAVNTAVACGPRPCGIGLQDEREIKREKRKQSNRESARRSRLRKQSEMEDLGKKVDSLTVENMALRSEINKLVEDSEKLSTENTALMEKLQNMHGQPATAVSSVRSDGQEKSHISTENLLSKVDSNSVSNGIHEPHGEGN